MTDLTNGTDEVSNGGSALNEGLVAKLDSEMDATYKLIAAAEKHAAAYEADERDDIRTDVLNAFYAGSKYGSALTRLS